MTEITNLANMMYSEGRFPEQMYKSIFITIPKVKGTAKCEKHRKISLMSHVTKLVLRVIMNRIRGMSLDIDPQDVKLLANLYWNQQAAVRHNGEISESISIKQGVLQGCVASPHLFVYTLK